MNKIMDTNDGTVFNVTDELFDVLSVVAHGEEISEWLTEEIDKDIIESLKERLQNEQR